MSGSDDSYFLNNAVYLMEDFLKQTGDAGAGVPYEGEVKYGPNGGALLEWRLRRMPNWY